jgi:hypothetical protein
MRSTISTLAWAIFLGTSWTWCIGMFLPVLLVRDLGVWAWIIFAVPNVIGAAAMAWVLPDARASHKLVADHGLACRWFSIITLAFHAFFWANYLQQILGSRAALAGIGVAIIALPLLALRRGDRIMATVVLVISIVAAAILLHRQLIPNLPPPIAPSVDLVWLTPVCAFGLMLCPYLDLTFHEARQATGPARGRAAFGIGFGGVFLAMILFTLAYSGWLTGARISLPQAVAIPLGVHLLAQTILKFGLHGRALISNLGAISAMILAVVSAAVCGMLCRNSLLTYHGLSIGEIVYRSFMGCYALMFPAYVWICIIGNRSKWNWIAAVAVATPMFWMGFIEREMIWLAPGVAVPVIAGFLSFHHPRQIPSRHAAS